MSATIFEPAPGGFSSITAGGTRTEIKLSRPWQPPLPLAPEKCPFCTKPQEEIKLAGIPEGWRLLPNPYTPHLRHRLAIPTACWEADAVYSLGGPKQILCGLKTIREAVKDDPVPMAAFAHIGQIAGQNLGHVHWHIHELRICKALAIRPKQYLVKRHGELSIYAAGTHAGECLIQHDQHPMFSQIVQELADAFSWTIELFKRKFQSTEGKPPEFIAAVRIAEDGRFQYADYCPMLATPGGGSQHIFSRLEGGSVTLPWPHEVTASYLRD